MAASNRCPNGPEGRASWGTWLILAFAVLVAATSVARMFFGWGPMDEGFYIAIPYRFALGARPFVDEANLVQGFGVLLAPVVSLFMHVTGGITGIVLFFRAMFGSLAVVSGVLAYWVSRRYLAPRFALLVALLPAVFMPWGIPSFSYNTIGAFGLLDATLLAWLSPQLEGRNRRWAAAAAMGVFLGASVASYPTLAPAGLGVLIWWLWISRRRQEVWMEFVLIALFALVPLAIVGNAAVQAGVDNIRRAFIFNTSVTAQGGGVGKLVGIAVATRVLILKSPMWVAALVVVACRRWLERTRYGRVVAVLGLIAVPLCLAFIAEPNVYARANVIMLFWAGSGFVLIATSRRPRPLASVWVGVELISLLGAALYAYSSNNGLLNAGVGVLPACVLGSIAFTLEGLRLTAAADGGDGEWSLVAAAPAATIVLAVVVAQLFGVYGETVPISEMRTPIVSGAYAGIITSSENVALAATLSADIGSVSRPGEGILFFNGFPGGYLLSALVPWADTVWSGAPPIVPGAPASDLWRFYERDLLQHYERTGRWPDVIVKMNLYDYPASYGPQHPVISWLAAEGYKPVVLRSDYTIYRRDAR